MMRGLLLGIKKPKKSLSTIHEEEKVQSAAEFKITFNRWMLFLKERESYVRLAEQTYSRRIDFEERYKQFAADLLLNNVLLQKSPDDAKLIAEKNRLLLIGWEFQTPDADIAALKKSEEAYQKKIEEIQDEAKSEDEKLNKVAAGSAPGNTNVRKL